ncbi:glycosyltransferase family 2 protein [Sphingomonas sp. MMS12-HWE2-04]|uniref:glycosyltransferase family 2 protein n=1 Tax=Sphingomonas sp. MMS12-HWE2-04 TaxID=3234199 RepID=UPI00384FFCB0
MSGAILNSLSRPQADAHRKPSSRGMLDLGEAPCKLVYSQGEQDSPPRVTIAIPTYNRPTLLKEAIESARAQAGQHDYEVVIVDNASSPESREATLKMLYEYPNLRLRYYVNADNVGIFPNWNRCLHLARGEWVSVLNDDDLLRPDFLDVMMAKVDSQPELEALICQRAVLDLRDIRNPYRGWKADLHSKLVQWARFKGRSEIRLTPARLFWANIAGSSLGALYRRASVVDLGGFNPGDAPIADYALNIRLAIRTNFWQVPEPLAVVRIQVNETMKPETLRGVLLQNYRLRSSLIERGSVPQRWGRWTRHLLAHELGAAQKRWGQLLDGATMAEALSIPPIKSSAGWMYIVRLLHGGV